MATDSGEKIVHMCACSHTSLSIVAKQNVFMHLCLQLLKLQLFLHLNLQRCGFGEMSICAEEILQYVIYQEKKRKKRHVLAFVAGCYCLSGELGKCKKKQKQWNRKVASNSARTSKQRMLI